jgi:hypothetical protein
VRPAFEELAGRTTELGDLSLRRRVLPSLDTEVYEVKLGDEFLMSSLFTAAEVELARLGLAQSRARTSMSSWAGSGWATRHRPCSRTSAWAR